jgi:hypothetical protein
MIKYKIWLLLKGSEDGKVQLRLIGLWILPLVLYSKQSGNSSRFQVMRLEATYSDQLLLLSTTLPRTAKDAVFKALCCSEFQITGSAQKSTNTNKIFGYIGFPSSFGLIFLFKRTVTAVCVATLSLAITQSVNQSINMPVCIS